MGLIESQRVDHGMAPVIGGIVAFCDNKLLPHSSKQTLGGTVIIILPPHSVAFVEKRKWHGSILSRELHEKSR